MLDFSRLRSGPDGWRGSFEDLVRQLGHLNPPASASEFRHIHGAGGDGGVEAYWTLADGGEHGYQAKFHTRPGDIDWGALDASIRTALSTRPRLVAIQVAIACDLSDVVAGRGGQPGWKRWETHLERWRALARGAGRDVEFLFWGATNIEAMLARPHPSVADASLPAVPRLLIAAVEPTAMPKWVFDADVPRDRLALASCADVVGDGGWLTLNRYAAARLDYAGDAKSVLDTRFRQEDFHFLMLVAVEPRARAAFVRAAKGADIDFHDWFTHDHVDGPYLYEAGVRATWPDRQWTTSSEFRGPALRFTRFTNGYQWESHLDGSLSEGFSMEVPAPWLLDALGLSADPHRPGVYVDADGKPAIVSRRGGSNAYCLVRREPMMTLLESRGLVPLWAGVGERTGWPRQGVNEGHRRRWNGLLWTVANGTRRETWCEDHTPDCEETR